MSFLAKVTLYFNTSIALVKGPVQQEHPKNRRTPDAGIYVSILCACSGVCVCVRVCVYIYICIYIYIYMHIYMHIYIYIHMHTYMFFIFICLYL